MGLRRLPVDLRHLLKHEAVQLVNRRLILNGDVHVAVLVEVRQLEAHRFQLRPRVLVLHLQRLCHRLAGEVPERGLQLRHRRQRRIVLHLGDRHQLLRRQPVRFEQRLVLVLGQPGGVGHRTQVSLRLREHLIHVVAGRHGPLHRVTDAHQRIMRRSARAGRGIERPIHTDGRAGDLIHLARRALKHPRQLSRRLSRRQLNARQLHERDPQLRRTVLGGARLLSHILQRIRRSHASRAQTLSRSLGGLELAAEFLQLLRQQLTTTTGTHELFAHGVVRALRAHRGGRQVPGFQVQLRHHIGGFLRGVGVVPPCLLLVLRRSLHTRGVNRNADAVEPVGGVVRQVLNLSGDTRGGLLRRVELRGSLQDRVEHRVRCLRRRPRLRRHRFLRRRMTTHPLDHLHNNRRRGHEAQHPRATERSDDVLRAGLQTRHRRGRAHANRLREPLRRRARPDERVLHVADRRRMRAHRLHRRAGHADLRGQPAEILPHRTDGRGAHVHRPRHVLQRRLHLRHNARHRLKRHPRRDHRSDRALIVLGQRRHSLQRRHQRHVEDRRRRIQRRHQRIPRRDTQPPRCLRQLRNQTTHGNSGATRGDAHLLQRRRGFRDNALNVSRPSESVPRLLPLRGELLESRHGRTNQPCLHVSHHRPHATIHRIQRVRHATEATGGLTEKRASNSRAKATSRRAHVRERALHGVAGRKSRATHA